MDIVTQVLEQAAKQARQFKSTNVEKHLDLEYDLGTLLAADTNELDLKQIRSEPLRQDCLRGLARDNTQLLINKLWELPTERVEEAIVVKLPAPTFVLPREKHVPKPKPPTKWEQFAKEKGIQKRKRRPKLKWDETLQNWVPLYGFRRVEAEKKKSWMLPVPDQADPMEDQFAKLSAVKNEQVAKNEYQRLRNLAKAKNVKVPRMGFPSADKMNSKQLGKAISVAKASTASIGKFQEKLPKEKKAKDIGSLLPSMQKRKVSHLVTSKDELKSNLDILDNVLKKKPKLDMEKAVNRALYTEQEERSQEKKRTKTKTGKKRAGSGGAKKSKGKKPSGGKGKRSRGKGGRKRR